MFPRRHSAIVELQLQKENDALRTEIVKLRHELTTKKHYAERLEVLLRERIEPESSRCPRSRPHDHEATRAVWCQDG